MAASQRTTVAIVGGGPAGMMLGLLLAKQGIDVTVFEKHRDFLRDFRGDTVHPSTMDLLDQLGLGEKFAKIPQGRLQGMRLSEDLQIGPITELKLKHPYIAIAPQWDFLNLLADEARQYPAFHLRMHSEVIAAVRNEGRIAGVRYRDETGAEHELRALLTIGADGRHSTIRESAGLPTRKFGAPFDVLWFRLSKPDLARDEFYFRVVPYQWVVGFDRRTYVQMAYIIPKGARDAVQGAGIAQFQSRLAEAVPEVADRVHELKSFDDLKFLEVQVNRAPRWHLPGLLLIGDSAHAMSPMGGVGVNYAIQDAVAAANILSEQLKEAQASGAEIPERLLRAVQRRRLLPTAVIQKLQRVAQERLVDPALHGKVSGVPRFARTLQRFGPLRRLFLHVLVVGVRQERIKNVSSIR